MPLISIITSTYNRADTFLPQCIDSINKQGYKNYEHIIVDDCSTDGTEEYISQLRLRKVRYYKTDKNSGSDPVPKNIGLKVAYGSYVMFVDDDVVVRPGAVNALYNEIKKGYDVVYGDLWLKPMDELGISQDFDLQLLSYKNYIDTSVALIRKEALEYIGGWDSRLPKFVDWNLFTRLAKAGFSFKHIPETIVDYYVHDKSKSSRVKTRQYEHPELGTLFVPTFNPVDCRIQIGKQKEPKVAVFTIHYDRLDYSKQTYKEMMQTAGYDFDWYCADNGTDGTYDWLKKVKTEYIVKYKQNVGLTKASNALIDIIQSQNKYDIIIKIDNDVEFITKNWLPDIIDLWRSNHLLYISPYVEGLIDNPGGALRVGSALIRNNLIEVTNHIGGIFAAVDAKAYKNFRWKDFFLHGMQDLEASENFRKQGYMPCYFPKHVIRHRGSTLGQQKDYAEYFSRRKMEKMTVAPQFELEK